MQKLRGRISEKYILGPMYLLDTVTVLRGPCQDEFMITQIEHNIQNTRYTDTSAKNKINSVI